MTQSTSNRTSRLNPRRVLPLAAAAILLGSFAASPLQAQIAGTYTVTNLVSDGSVPATTIDANFINPWAISASGTWWINTAGTGFSYIVPGNTALSTFGTINGKVGVPPASGLTTATGLPAGIVTTGGATGMIMPAPNSAKASFLFSTLDGTISAWNSKLTTAAGTLTTTLINNSAAGASYPGITIYNTATTSVILAANFGAGRSIEAYDSTFAPTHLAGSFTDPNLPSNYAPFSIHILNGKIYVAYTTRGANNQPAGGPGVGILDVFDTTGAFVARAITGGNLNDPWGVAIAPTGFGIFGGSLLVGNFGDGHINAYDPTTFAFKGQLADGTGKALSYPSLWELLPGGTIPPNGTASGGDTSTVYFTAGLANEAHGLFAGIANSTSATGSANFGFSTGDKALTIPAGTSGQTIISVAPTNNFSGTVNLACTGLPANSTCLFTPASITASAAAPSTATLIITTTKGSARLIPYLRGAHTTTITAALLLPFASILAFYRRRSPLSASPLRLLSMGIMLATLGLIAGCSSNSPAATPPTPTGTSQVTVTATSGAITQSTTIAVTVQ